MQLNKTIIMFFLFIFFSCGDKLKNDKNIVKEYYSNGILKSEFNYKNGKEEVLAKYYREDGTLESEINYKNDVPDGYSFWYHEDGLSIEGKGFWLYGKQFGSNESYYKDGTNKMYTSLDFIGETFFVIKWDEEGQQIKYEGLVFSPNIGLTETKPKVGEKIQVRVAVATPPETKTIIKMGLLEEDKQMLDIVDFSAMLPITFKDTGNYTMVTIGELYDLKGMLIQRDSLATNIVVSE